MRRAERVKVRKGGVASEQEAGGSKEGQPSARAAVEACTIGGKRGRKVGDCDCDCDRNKLGACHERRAAEYLGGMQYPKGMLPMGRSSNGAEQTGNGKTREKKQGESIRTDHRDGGSDSGAPQQEIAEEVGDEAIAAKKRKEPISQAMRAAAKAVKYLHGMYVTLRYVQYEGLHQ